MPQYKPFTNETLMYALTRAGQRIYNDRVTQSIGTYHNGGSMGRHYGWAQAADFHGVEWDTAVVVYSYGEEAGVYLTRCGEVVAYMRQRPTFSVTTARHMGEAAQLARDLVGVDEMRRAWRRAARGTGFDWWGMVLTDGEWRYVTARTN